MNVSLTYEWNAQVRTISSSDDIVVINIQTKGHRTRVDIQTSQPITIQKAVMTQSATFQKGDQLFINGYQSWTDTKEVLVGEKVKQVAKLPKKLIDQYALDGYGDTLFKDYTSGVYHGWEMAESKYGFIGSYNWQHAYLIINYDINNQAIVLESDVKGLSVKDAFTLFDYGTNKEEYLSSMTPKPCPKLLGYTSWYNYYQDIDEEKIQLNLQAIDRPFELFQIDDGFETYVGDWLDVDASKFPNGLQPIVDAIHQKGLKAGIWLAPFIAEEKSKIYQEHPEWFLKTKAGSNWSGFYGMDVTNSEAMHYVDRCLQHYVDLGFDFFKLDFLYAINLHPTHEYTRAQLTQMAYERIDSCLKDKTILGCGAMLTNAIGKFNYMRIGPDVSLKFDDLWYMKFLHRERISTKVTLQNTIYRSFLDGHFFGNDPDVFLLRDDNISLSKEQRKALLKINALFGSVLMTSDTISDYDQERKELLQDALALWRAKDVTYHRDGKQIRVEYTLHDTRHAFVYDTQKGVLI